MNCKNENIKCSNLVLRKATKGKYIGQEFFGCSLYPECSYQIPLHFNPDIMSDNDKELARAFGLFVRSNYFIYAKKPYGTSCDMPCHLLDISGKFKSLSTLPV